MTNYNERLYEVLQQNIQFTLLGEFPNAVPDHNNWVNVMGRVYSFDFTEAKQAITSLIKELVAEAKPKKHNTDVGDAYQCTFCEEYNKGIDQFEQNLL